MPCRLVDSLTDTIPALLDPGCEGTAILRNVGDYLPVDRA